MKTQMNLRCGACFSFCDIGMGICASGFDLSFDCKWFRQGYKCSGGLVFDHKPNCKDCDTKNFYACPVESKKKVKGLIDNKK